VIGRLVDAVLVSVVFYSLQLVMFKKGLGPRTASILYVISNLDVGFIFCITHISSSPFFCLSVRAGPQVMCNPPKYILSYVGGFVK